ncbi:MAG: pyruvate kinase [Candidatus Thorarchaeota archaeon]|nr:pyruvate kinase [Candidatus Thorarchaeota archaeon]
MIFDRTRSKIVCTIGPASRLREVLEGMIEAGMDVARLNMSHADHPTAKKTFNLIRSIDDTIPILFDLQGPKIRIGELKAPVTLTRGDELILSTENFVGDGHRVSVSHKEMPQDVKVGDTIAVNDGIVRLRVKEIRGEEIVTEVTHGGPISSRKGVNVPGIKLSCGIPTEQDLRDLDLAAELEPDLIALSFVTSPEEIRRIRGVLDANGPRDASIISKIEHILAVENFDAIVKESQGIMIARGDLGIEVPIEDVPVLQRELIKKANMWARPVIVATHMLESMTHEQMPTRAEVSDVAHAILDRADAVMLSGETAVGEDPVGVVVMMNKIVKRVEETLPPIDPLTITSPRKMIVEIIGTLVYNTVCLIPEKVGGIITATRSGFTARWISKYRPPVHIFAVTANVRVMRRSRLLWGVHPVYYEQDIDNVDDLVKETVRIAYKQGLIEKDKDVVFTSGTRHIPGRTNIMALFHVRDLVE